MGKRTPKACVGLIFSRESGRSLDGLVFKDEHVDSTISPPPRSSRGSAASAALAAAAPDGPRGSSPEGSWGWGSFSGCPREGQRGARSAATTL